jgi:hypothetical protein
MQAPTGGWAAPATAAQPISAGTPGWPGNRANVIIAAAETAAPVRSTTVWPARSTQRASTGLETPSAIV